MSVKDRIENERKNLVKKTFSQSLFLELMKEYINEPDFQSHVMKVEDGKAVKIMKYPVKEFRKVIMNVLVDYGIDAKEAESVLTDYKFKSKDLDGIYTFVTDFMYQYLQTGRRLKVLDKEDVVASMILKDVEAADKTYTRKKDGKVLSVSRKKIGKHKKLAVKSSAPVWEKAAVDEKGKVQKVMERVIKDL